MERALITVMEKKRMTFGEDAIPLFLGMPESASNVFCFSVGCNQVESLVGIGLAERTLFHIVMPNLDVVKVFCMDGRCYYVASRIPGDLDGRVVMAQVGCIAINHFRLRIASHEANARDEFTILADERINYFKGERSTYVVPQMWAVTTRATIGTVADVDSQSGFVGYLLKYHVVVITFEHDGAGIRLVVARRRAAAEPEHRNGGLLLPVGAWRSC